jgi:Uma2 family endonuclease
MSTIAPPPPRVAPAPPPGPPPYRLTVDEYERIGALLDDQRVELIDGLIVKKMPKSTGHIFTTEELRDTLDGRLTSGWSTRQEQPVRIPAYDEPEPDITVVRGARADYKQRMPTAADVALLVEVSDSSLAVDRGLKMLAYAKDRIPVYWIVNLVDRQVEVYTRPSKSGYRSRQEFKPGQQVPVKIGGRMLAPILVDAILP